MKKITQLLTLLVVFMAISNALAQKAVVIGTNHATPDGFAFLVTQDLANGETVYFTEDEYNNVTNVFSSGESVVRFTASAAVPTGTVIFVNEVSTNTFTTSCCGTAAHFGGSFSLRTDGEAYYAYQDSDTDPSNGVTEIYSVFYTGEVGQPTPGGPIPAALDPTPDFPNAIVVDGFPTVSPGRAEYQFAAPGVRDGLCRDNLENVSNYLHGQANQPLSTISFNSFTLACTSPTVTLTSSPASVAENSGSSITYTFTISPTAGSSTTVNFNVSGSATFSSDYTQSGAASFSATAGTVVIGAGSSTATVTLTPTGDTTLEPDETAILTLAAGAGYTAGSPSIATGTITNDDTQNITPVVAVTGLNNAVSPGIEGFSFVALDDIAAGTEVFFTEEEFNINTLAFSSLSGEGVVRWTAPAGGVLRGEVIVATENTPDTFTATCDSGTCGTFTTIITGFTFASNGEGFFAYSDSDTDPTNGVGQVHSVLYTGSAGGGPGGNIPALEDPSSVYVGAVVVDGFPAVQPQRTEYNPALRGVTVDQANFQNTANWLHAQAPATLDTTPFANIIIATGSPNPSLIVSAVPTSVVEDSGTGIVYTFTLSAAATSDITVNFDVAGSATLTTDYTVAGADTFTATSGTATILMGNTTVDVTVTPVVDTMVEPTETIELMIASGTGYDGGSPNSATGSITNDDTSASDPLVAVMGMTHDSGSADSFSFAAAQDVPAGTVVYFTEDEFDNTTLLFSAGGEAVLQWTSPGGQIDQGDVIVATETGPNVFTLTCSDTSGNGCGTLTTVSGTFAIATNGESLFAYADSDTDPTNGVADIYSVMYTGNSGAPGGNLPAMEDPTGIYLNALVVDGFPAAAPDKTEYIPASRAVPVGQADFEDPSNYDHATAFGTGLSTVPFASLSIVVSFTAPADLCVDAGVQTGLGGGTPTGGVYSGPGVTDDGNGMTYSFDPAAAGVGVHTITYTSGGGSASDDIEVFALPTVTFTAPADLCIDAGVQTGLGGGTPTGGVYSGTGVTDDGNGMTYSFDPAAAGVGTHTLTYTFTDANGCSASATDDVEVFALPSVTFTALADLCVDAGVQTGIGGGSPTGGVYSGVGVTDDGNGMTYSFDPAAAGVGTHTITYTFTDANGCTASASDDVEVFALPIVAFTAPASPICPNATLTGQGGGTPTGGVYSGPGVIDDGNGMTFTFDAAAAGTGTHTLTYTFTDANGCSNSASDMVTVEDTTPPVITCPADIIVSNDPGVCEAVVTFADPTATDNCGTVTVSQTGGPTSGSTFPVGTTVITYIATDGSGNTDTCSFNIVVEDTEDPVALCQDVTVQLDATGTATVSTIDVDNGSSDNCPPVTLSLGAFTFTGQTLNTDPTDQYFPPNAWFYNEFSFVAPVDGTYELLHTGTSSNGAGIVAILYDAPPVRNSGNVNARPEFIGFTNRADDGTFVFGTTTYTLTGGQTYYLDVTAVSFGETTSYEGAVSLVGDATFDCDDVGTNSILLIATDPSGNVASCTSTITVEDNIAPDPLTCPADITVSNDPGQCNAVVTFTLPTATDNCPGTVVTASPASGSTFPVGTTAVTVTATDASGNTTSCTFNVTVNDTEDPIVTCPADITVSNDPGQCSAVVNFTPTVSDKCPGVTLVSSPASGSVFPVGTTLVTVTGTDAAGNTATCTFNVTVNDTENPTISCPADITVNNDPGDCGAVVTYTAPTGSDNCPASTTVQTSGLPSGSIFPVGVTVNTFEVTDATGNTATCSFNVTVIDNENPTITCPADITASNDPGVCEAAITVPQPTFDDNCFTNGCVRNDDLESYALGSINGQDANWVGWTGAAAEAGEISAEQAQSGTQSLKIEGVPGGGPVDQVYNLGNLTSGVWEVTYSLYIPVGNTAFTNIQKFERPAGGPQWGHQIQWNSNGTAEYNVNSGYNTFTYPQGAWFEVRHLIDLDNDFTEFFVNGASVISHPYSYQAFSNTGAISLGGINFFPITNFFGANGSETNPAAIPLFYVDDVSMCALPINDYNNTSDASDTYPVGTTNVVWTITDAGGNTASCTQVITVNDTEDPVITCPADITVSNDLGICGATINYSVTATDNCATITPGIVSINPLKDNSLFEETPGNSNGAGQLMYVGQNGVGENHRGVLTFDVAGSVPAGATITGVTLTMTADHPTASNGAHDFNLHRLLEDWGEGASDNGTAPGSGGGGFGVPGIAPDATWDDAMLGTPWASGSGGNFNPASSAGQTVDTNGPYNWTSAGLISDVQDMLDNPGANFGWIIIGNETTGGTTKRFGTRESAIPPVLQIVYETIAGVTITQTAGLPSGSVFPVGTTTNTFVVTDTAGNTDTCSFDVTVNDTEAPIAVCQDITIQLDANGDASITAADIDGGSTDNCGIASLAVTPSVFDCSDVGANTVTLTVTDLSGNSSTCTATVTVEDNVAPDAVCMDIDLFLDATGNASITPADVDGGSTDACGIASLAIDITDFTCADVGPNDVTLTVTDVNGNTSSCIAVVTVIDNTPPVISCPTDVVTGTDPGLCSAMVTFSDAIASDECGIASVVQTAGLPSGSDFPVGVNTVEFTATDVNGNTTTCSFTITVNDDEPAMAVCQDITIQLDDTGNATITPADVDGGSTDNCGIASLDIDIDTFDCSNVGDNPVVLTVTDDNGNVSTCTAIVTVEDVTAPEVFCQDIIVDLDATGTVTISGTDIDNGSTDACGIASYDLDIDTFDCSNVGDNVVTLTVTDVNGNSASCTAIVTVQDVTDPVLTCMDITVELDENGMAVIEPEDVIDTLDDACGILTTAIDIFEFSCDDIGTPVTVQVFANDVNGNLATCTATVTVIDALPPVLTCPEDQTVDPGPGNLFYEIPDYFAIGEATAVDNCTDPVTDVTQDPAPGTLVPDGVYTITMTATDDSGNTATCTFELTVESVLGLDDLPVDLSTIVVYPNPATDVVFISNPQNIILDKVTLFDLVGRKVATYDLRNAGIETSLDISNLATASYTMVIEGSGGQINKRLIKE
ncbi:MAG: HYR domain-containing protein [Flavobacteriaceae bacterium]|nr:HYR domain-containing protein [Flavobacteriaceae bacterium]